ncbi:hypothetical protein SPF06_02110 [Sinomonas sp. JGH33]|uniref:Uncharacterized protein n=1 Tax=Sinomonas terricola TaxID=3110330 RepID=A0ABU5T1U6_9MICC|nr:hypothetical protein [Sinomonas sp. JGH33]MEA5453507.1 hypothetical protein [Sinomonas sp. JGH33]
MSIPEQQDFQRGPSVGTMVWGVVIVAIAGLLLASRLGWFSVDPAVASVSILVIAGVGLVVGGTLAAARGRKALDGAAHPGAPSGLGEHAPSSAGPSQTSDGAETPRPNPYESGPADER